MDRSAIFVDAGYLLAEGGKLCCGTGNRQLIATNFASLTEAIGGLCGNAADAPILRTYWYDAAQDGIPTSEQLQIAALPFVKLRLGRLSGGRQKGVDSLILRDIMVLASTRSIATAFLLAGDEDLREAVVYAQDVGVRVVLIGVEPSGHPNQADTLVREVDQRLTLTKASLGAHLTPANPPTAPSATANLPALASAAATSFAETWSTRATADELRDLLGKAPVLPPPLDRELLFAVQAMTGPLEGRDDLRKLIRAVFWKRLRGG